MFKETHNCYRKEHYSFPWTHFVCDIGARYSSISLWL